MLLSVLRAENQMVLYNAVFDYVARHSCEQHSNRFQESLRFMLRVQMCYNLCRKIHHLDHLMYLQYLLNSRWKLSCLYMK